MQGNAILNNANNFLEVVVGNVLIPISTYYISRNIYIHNFFYVIAIHSYIHNSFYIFEEMFHTKYTYFEHGSYSTFCHLNQSIAPKFQKIFGDNDFLGGLIKHKNHYWSYRL